MISGFITNKAFDFIINDFKKYVPVKIDMDRLGNLLFPPFKVVCDCVIISNEKKEYLEKYYLEQSESKDKTFYEARNTETRINEYIESDDMDICTEIELAFLVIKSWYMQLRHIDSDAKFCFIISCDENNVELRFHKSRHNERSWLGNNIDIYNDPVGYIIL